MLVISQMKDAERGYEVLSNDGVVMDGLTEDEAHMFVAGWLQACRKNQLPVPKWVDNSKEK